ncbi:hypothetical protein, partial [Plasmodium yoelii yoelii]
MYKLSNINSRDIENAINFHDNLSEMIEEEDGEKPDDISLGTSEYFDKIDILEKRIEEENKIIDIFNKSLDVNDTEYNKIMSYSKLLSHDVDNNTESEEIKINETIEERENFETSNINIEKRSNNNSNTNLYQYNEHYEKNEINDSQSDDIQINSTKHNQDTNTNRYKLHFSFLTYTLRSFSNILMLIVQTSLIITNLIIVSTSLPINNPINNKIIVNMQAQGTNKLLNNIYLFYMTYLIFFLALNLLYTFYVFFSNKNFLSKLFAQRKIYFSNVFPYSTKSFNE